MSDIEKKEDETTVPEENRVASPRPRIIDVPVPVKFTPFPRNEKPQASGKPQAPVKPAGPKRKALTIVSPAEGVVFEGELVEIIRNLFHHGDPIEIAVVADERNPDSTRHGMASSMRVKQAIDLAKQLGWPSRRVYVRIEFKTMVELKHGRRVWDADVEVALLLPYDRAVQTIDELKAIPQSQYFDGMRVLVREKNIVFRMDLRGRGSP